MKIQTRDIEGFIKKPGVEFKIILIYGPDEGLARERITTLAGHYVTDIKDPFNVANITQDQIDSAPSALFDEAFSMSMMGGQRVILIKDASNKITEHLKTIEADADKLENIILIQAGNLTPSSSLRKFAEKSKVAAAVPCYIEDERSLSGFLSGYFKEQGYTIDRDALVLAASILHGDRALARNEAEKIAIYKGNDKSPITTEDLAACLGTGNFETLDALVQNVASGHSKGVEKSLDILFSEGNPPILILRSLKNYFKRLYITQGRLPEMGLDGAMKKLYPPVFFKHKQAFQTHIRKWPLIRIKKAFEVLNDAEKTIKSGGLEPELTCNRAALSLSKIAGR